MVDKALFSSASDEWATPQWLFDQLNEEFGFTLDAAASDENHKCERYNSIERWVSTSTWSNETVFLNCPYSEISKWHLMSWQNSLFSGATVVSIVPARTDTRWWHDYATKAAEIRFLKGRLKFGNAKNSAPFPSAILVFRPGHIGPPKVTFVSYKAPK